MSETPDGSVREVYPTRLGQRLIRLDTTDKRNVCLSSTSYFSSDGDKTLEVQEKPLKGSKVIKISYLNSIVIDQ